MRQHWPTVGTAASTPMSSFSGSSSCHRGIIQAETRDRVRLDERRSNFLKRCFRGSPTRAMSRRIRVRRVFSGRLRLIGSPIFIALLAPLPAQASLLWNWTYTGGGIAARGTFTTDEAPDGSGYYHITGITGSRNGVAVTGLEPTGEAIPGNSGFPVDNLITAGGLLTSHGFGFATADGNYANPFYADFRTPPRFLEVFTQPASMGFTEVPIQFTAAIVQNQAR